MAQGYGGTWQRIDPFNGLGESVVTSNVISTRFAFDVGCSFYTTSGATSANTWWVSNASGNPHVDETIDSTHPSTWAIPEATWSAWTMFGHAAAVSSGASFFDPPLGFRFARITRENSGASFTYSVSRLER